MLEKKKKREKAVPTKAKIGQLDLFLDNKVIQ